MRLDFEAEGPESQSEGDVHGEPVCLESAVFGWWTARESRTSLQRASCVSPTSLDLHLQVVV